MTATISVKWETVQGETKMIRQIVKAVECPIDLLIRLRDCKKCPYFDYESLSRARVSCNYVIPIVEDRDPIKDKEIKSKW